MDLEKLKYNIKWIEFGFASEDDIILQNEEFDKGEDPNPEHYRYGSFMKWIKSKNLFEDAEIENFIDLVNIDEDQGMASSAMSYLFSSRKLTEVQYVLIKSELSKYGNWAMRKIAREEIRRNKKS